MTDETTGAGPTHGEQPQKSGSTHTSTWPNWVAGVLVVLIILASGWVLRGCVVADPPAQTASPQVFVFDPDRALELMSANTGGSDPLLEQTERIERIEGLLDQISRETGAIVVHANATMAFPDAIDITEQAVRRADELGQEPAPPTPPGDEQ